MLYDIHFFGTRATLLLDLVAGAMAVVAPTLAFSVAFARRGRWVVHRRLQVALTAALGLLLLAFELEMRLAGWQHLAEPSPYFQSWVYPALYVHLAFAVTTAIVWTATVSFALRGFPSPPRPGPHSEWHRRLGWVAVVGMLGTAVTGWAFYWLAFAAV